MAHGVLYDENSAESESNEPAGDLTRSIASTRLRLRRTFGLAMTTDKANEVIRYANIFNTGCGRLVKLLKIEARAGSDREAEITATINQAIAEVSEELGLSL